MRTWSLVVALGCLAGGGYAAEDAVLPGMAFKFGYGFVDTLTGIVEVPMQTVKGYQHGIRFIRNKPTSKAAGTVWGFFVGLGAFAGRTAHGAVNVVTFWTANRADNHGIGIPLDAPFAWEQGESYSIWEPSLEEGLMPYPRKLGHGLADGFLGIVDVPGQIVRGARSEFPITGVGVGIVRGLWFGLSRHTTGMSDAVLFLLPNPGETRGYGYDHSWPWGALLEREAPAPAAAR